MSETVTYRVKHTSTVSYAAEIAQARFNLRLRPYRWPGQVILDDSLTVDPTPALMTEADGPYLVNTTRLQFTQPLHELTVTSRFHVAITQPPPPQSPLTISQLREQAVLSRDLTVRSPAPYLFASRIAQLDPDIADWAAPMLQPDCNILDAAYALNHAVHEKIKYVSGSSNSRTSPADAFRAGRGVCQDQSHVMIAALRSHAIPAAYVSGYLNTLPPPGEEKLVGADAMHAWVAVWCGEGTGWVAFDPTNDRLADTDHVTIGMGRDFADVSPIDGVFIGNTIQKLKYAVDVRRVDEDETEEAGAQAPAPS
ncbi:transglutaminase family protein [Croceicoccus mobilis]|uniref:Transglutaminase n=1 Tax=Croceicoccus mobilis TaxID=1703339 RepID=A0A917DV92_9SPHN|nr:transglutaminase family protein [Croceicoccus mobilis]GGD70026.1 transglutaminase [Croceicoccus mobilis]